MKKRVKNGLESLLGAAIMVAVMGFFIGILVAIAGAVYFSMTSFGSVTGTVVLGLAFLVFAFLLGFVFLPKDD